VIDKIRRLMVHDTAGDPVTGLRWTRKTTEKVSQELKKNLGITVSPKTVGRLLKGMKYSLRVNHKAICHTKNPDRNRQFLKIQRTRVTFERDGLPIVSVDTKKKEQIGQFRNAGRVWTQEAILVNDHDFRKDAVGIGVPYGLFDPVANRGHVVVGTSRDTADFAVDALVYWWKHDGGRRYSGAKRLLILADNGGGNGARNRAWKHRLQTRLVDPFALSVTGCHYPPGASMWNPIEHRLFSEVTKNWAGQPLSSYETILKFIRTTKTKTGLRTRATLMRGDYPTGVGVKIPDSEMAKLRLRRHAVLPEWNYTLSPRL
jgi:hypothetical protein